MLAILARTCIMGTMIKLSETVIQTMTIKPATPLPWYQHTSADQFKKPVIVSRPGAGRGCVTRIVEFPSNLSCEQANAAYIVHACNAYPELVAALRECLTDDGAAAERNHTNAMQRLAAINEAARAGLAKLVA